MMMIQVEAGIGIGIGMARRGASTPRWQKRRAPWRLRPVPCQAGDDPEAERAGRKGSIERKDASMKNAGGGDD
jgi:hypothetical protein